MRVEEILAELVAIDSTSSRTNAEMINVLAARAERLGFCARTLPYEDERGTKKLNLVCVPPHAGADHVEAELALVGHTDTVPFDPAWGEALRLTERDGRLYGRGACDTKAFIAAALAAAERTGAARLRRPPALVFTADEEVGCVGAKRLADAGVLSARRALVGEPTSLRPVRAGKGYCVAEVRVRGREAHSAYPALGASAVYGAARLVSRVERVAEALQGEPHAAFDPPHTTVNVGLIEGGTAKNIIPGACRFTVEWRPVPGQAASRAADLIQAEADALTAAGGGISYEIEPARADAGFETPADSPLVRFMERATDQTAGTVAFFTEAPQLARMGAEAVVFGPGDIGTAHRTGEFVPRAELERCVDILAHAIEEFCL